MTWIITGRGHRVDLLGPRPEQIDWRDIVGALARMPRFTGHAVAPNAGRGRLGYSVAAHLLNGAALIYDAALPWWLLHDAHEAYIGDLSTPGAMAIAAIAGRPDAPAGQGAAESEPIDPVREIKRRLDRAILAAFGLADPLPDVAAAVKAIDGEMLRRERAALMPHHDDWPVDDAAAAAVAIDPLRHCAADPRTLEVALEGILYRLAGMGRLRLPQGPAALDFTSEVFAPVDGAPGREPAQEPPSSRPQAAE